MAVTVIALVTINEDEPVALVKYRQTAEPFLNRRMQKLLVALECMK